MILEVGLPFAQVVPGAGRPATGLTRTTTSESVSEEDIYTCKKRNKGRRLNVYQPRTIFLELGRVYGAPELPCTKSGRPKKYFQDRAHLLSSGSCGVLTTYWTKSESESVV